MFSNEEDELKDLSNIIGLMDDNDQYEYILDPSNIEDEIQNVEHIKARNLVRDSVNSEELNSCDDLIPRVTNFLKIVKFNMKMKITSDYKPVQKDAYINPSLNRFMIDMTTLIKRQNVPTETL